MSFSGGLKLTDLDDHITPSVACILPVESKFEKKDPEKKGGFAKTIIQLEDGDAFEVIDGESQKLEKATIDLNDCLACSGCITTAESILVSLQSHLELYKALENKLDPDNPIQHIVVSIAPQVFANLAAKFNVPSQKIISNLVRFLHLLGVDQVIDVTIGRDLSLVYSAQEFVQNYRHRQNPTNAVNTTPLNTPILSSLCPGWICYAEKTHGFILPHISKVKSPQQIVGSLVKYWYGSKINLRPDQIYHVSVMPCYDKKLEASRQDFYNDIFSTRDVDCVLTTTEMEKLMEEKGYNWDESTEDVMDSPLHKLSNIPPNIAQEWQYYPSSPHLYSLSSSTTGGYVNYIMQHAAKELFNIDLSVEHSHNVSIKTIRNSDYQEISLINGDTTVLKFALAYGFRNIQNIIRKAKTNKVSQYDYVEIMACPSGCINGGGQAKHQNLHSKEWTAQMLTKYSEMNPFPQLPHLNPLLLALDQDWQPTHGEFNYIVTDYKAVENTITATTGLATKW